MLPVIGPLGAAGWQQTINSVDIVALTRDFLFRIEAGSARKPNKATRVEQMQMSVQTLGPILSQLVGAGMPGPFNALMSDWADSLDIDPTPYLVPPPPPPPTEPPMPPGAPLLLSSSFLGPPSPGERAEDGAEELPQVPQELNP